MRNQWDTINLKEKFHQFGYKYTEQRQFVFDALLEHQDLHLSNDDICKYLKQKGISIGQSTVYRTLNMLEKMQIVRRTDLDDGFTRYEIIDDDERHAHHHLICTKCGCIMDIKNDLLEALEQQISQNYQFEIEDHCLTFYGVCNKCKL